MPATANLLENRFVIVAVIFTAANVTNYVFRYVFLAICVVIGGYLTKRYERYAVIIATSLGGAYCVMFGIDMFVQSEFRSTFHVMLSQSTDRFHPVAGTWVMIAFVPVIAAIGTAWEWKHHEAPVGSWWFGHGARPLPPLPGERPHRKCCGITMALSAKAAKAAKAAKETEEKTTGSDTTLVSPSTKTTTMAGEAKAGSSSLPLSWSHWCFPCCTRRNNKTTTAEDNGPSSTAEAMEAEPMTVVVASDAPATEGSSPREEKPYNVLVNEKSKPTAGPSVTFIKEYDIPIERAYFSSGRETIGHTGVQKVVIQREVREFGVDVDEKL
ncbi:hypothetical protein BCR41DRAFT_60073 [Lobosporangium transversale]|uniref:TM7S3/TM198-like domain-containing protein n=1 Tax=Lobosporangium transversale TaxID=64571 RepID=A0A1Y2GS58_9FUNG|nr:hypothetical protein BCR41DRAFT_60073 [Lobosporangium transversale]ORZ16083.1 hypothetical protein BCR41DRAFT_60073 [Lobosporangium transversale]|eukprot:XP_021881430.1 hypothetical protein BCR41DRAFT_60073 [Lobosporangium transversale]